MWEVILVLSVLLLVVVVVGVVVDQIGCLISGGWR